MANQFHSDIPAQVIADVQMHLDAIKATLAPYLLSLTPDGRKSMLRMADKTVAFVTKTTEYATTNAAFVPAFVDLAELKQETAGMAALAPLRQQVRATGPRHRLYGDGGRLRGLRQRPHGVWQHQAPG